MKLLIFIFTMLISCTACNSKSQNHDSKDSHDSHDGKDFDTQDNEADSYFTAYCFDKVASL